MGRDVAGRDGMGRDVAGRDGRTRHDRTERDGTRRSRTGRDGVRRIPATPPHDILSRDCVDLSAFPTSGSAQRILCHQGERRR